MNRFVTVADARFPLGRLLLTPAANEALTESGASLAGLLARHASGDWGGLDPEDREANERALGSGGRLLSSYRLESGASVWIITEADRSATTCLLPEDY